MNPLRQAIKRTLATTAIRASGAPAGALDDPKFYSMVLEFTESAADILEKKLLDDTEIYIGASDAVKKAQLEAQKRSTDQKRKFIQGKLSILFFSFYNTLQVSSTLFSHASQFSRPTSVFAWMTVPWPLSLVTVPSTLTTVSQPRVVCDMLQMLIWTRSR